MKLQCVKCGKTFLYAQKEIRQAFPSEGGKYPENISERHVCPYCQSFELEEPTEHITSVKSADLSEVDALLKEGYEVHELYAKTATLVKKEKKEG